MSHGQHTQKNSCSDDALDDDGDDLDDGKVGDGNDGGMMTCFPYDILSILKMMMFIFGESEKVKGWALNDFLFKKKEKLATHITTQ